MKFLLGAFNKMLPFTFFKDYFMLPRGYAVDDPSVSSNFGNNLCRSWVGILPMVVVTLLAWAGIVSVARDFTFSQKKSSGVKSNYLGGKWTASKCKINCST